MILALILAIAVAVLRTIMFYRGIGTQDLDLLFVHFMAIVTVVFFTCQQIFKRQHDAGLQILLRDSLKGIAVYALVSAGLILLHYKTLEAEGFAQRLQEIVTRAEAEGQDVDMVRRFFTPFNYASLWFFALLFAGAINAILISLLQFGLRRFMR